jgi:hypothetical protein
MELDAAPGSLPFFAPVTTPFGYFGPSWKTSGIVDASLNFSLWSYRRGATAPRTHDLSHLLAVGNREARFGNFSHEGTGVKIRGWEPLKDRGGQRQVLALRVEPGEIYDTYYAYFYAEDECRWRLFGVGRQLAKPHSSKILLPGAFVEVPGRPSRQRTGVYRRRMRYRGWIVDDRGDIHTLNQMSISDINPETQMTESGRGVTADGRFYLETGGWTYRRVVVNKGECIELPHSNAFPEYLSEESLMFLQTIPSRITVESFQRVPNGVLLRYSVVGLGKGAKVTVCFGPHDELTFRDAWAHECVDSKPCEGLNELLLPQLPEAETLFARMLLVQDEGQYWSMQTASMKTSCSDD